MTAYATRADYCPRVEPITLTCEACGSATCGAVCPADAITDRLLATPDGATVPTDPAATVPATGYVVADPRHGAILATPDRDAVRTWVVANLTATPYLGVWVDVADGRTYLDAVRILPDRDAAMALGRDAGEIAIWDLGAQAEVRL